MNSKNIVRLKIISVFPPEIHEGMVFVQSEGTCAAFHECDQICSSVIINQIVAVFNFQFGVVMVITNQIVAVFNFQFEVAMVIINQIVAVFNFQFGDN